MTSNKYFKLFIESVVKGLTGEAGEMYSKKTLRYFVNKKQGRRGLPCRIFHDSLISIELSLVLSLNLKPELNLAVFLCLVTRRVHR